MIGLGLHLTTVRPARIPSGVTGTKIYADFASGDFFVNGQSQAASSFLSCNRPSVARLYDGTAFAANSLRIGPDGILIEESRTNYFLDSFAPATQTLSLTAGDYCISVRGAGDAALSGLASGTAIQGAPVQFSLANAGDVTVTTSGALDWVQVEKGLFPTSPILTSTAPQTRSADVVKLIDPTVFTPQAADLTVEWEQLQSGTFAQKGVNNLVRWTTPESWSRIRAGTVTFAQLAAPTTGFAMNNGVNIPTTVGVHALQLISSASGISMSWTAGLTGTAGSASTANVVSPTAPLSFQLGGANTSEILNGFIRKLIIA